MTRLPMMKSNGMDAFHYVYVYLISSCLHRIGQRDVITLIDALC